MVTCFVKAKVHVKTLVSGADVLRTATTLTMRIHNYEGRVHLLAGTRVRGPKGHWSANGGSKVDGLTEVEVALESLDGPVPYSTMSRCQPHERDITFLNRLLLYSRGRPVAAGVVEESLDKDKSQVEGGG